MNERKSGIQWEAMFQGLMKFGLLTYPLIVTFGIGYAIWVGKGNIKNESDIRELKTWKNEGHAASASILKAEILNAVGVDARHQSDENANRIESLRGVLTTTTAELATFRALTEHKMNEMAQSQRRMLEILEGK
jgi:hypothetical protein